MRYLPLTAALLLATAASAARADTYQFYDMAGSSGSIDNYGFSNNGNSFVLYDSVGALCGSYSFNGCYLVFTPGSGWTPTQTRPGLNAGNGPGNFTVNQTSGGALLGPLTITDQGNGQTTTLYSMPFGSTLVNSFGDVAFIGYAAFDGADENILAVNQTTHAAVAVTPEPSSVALLGTGLLGVAGVLRRRLS